MSKAQILIVEDDPDIRELLAYNLGKEGYLILQAGSSESALELMEAQLPDLILLDVMLPGMDGLEFLGKLKSGQTSSKVPVILVSAKGEETDVVAGLELGAEDYVTKPFSPRVLLARVRTALRRRSRTDSTQPLPQGIKVGSLSLDAARHETLLDGTRLDLSATEFAILEVLARSPGRVFTRSQIIDSVRGHDYPVTDRSVDVQILAIRKKLGTKGDLVETVRGVGYRLRDEQ
jgi:two-component system, OmpR family, alkaline phosphatase synthesis response regulator PhoP